MGPLEQNNLWQTDGLIGTSRFLDRVWRLVTESLDASIEKDDPSVTQSLHRMIQKVGADIDRLSLNTARKAASLLSCWLIAMVHLA